MIRTKPASRILDVTPDASLCAVLGPARALHFAAMPGAETDVPAHVRAASAVRRLGARLVIVQDDVSALVLLDAATGDVTPLLLPAGTGGARTFDVSRGNKQHKMDLEACAVLPDGRLVAFGSGSSPRRETLVLLDPDATEARLVDGMDLYRTLRELASSHGAELNIEGAVVRGDALWLVQRGHGKRPTACWNALLELPLEDFTAWLGRPSRAPVVRGTSEVRLGCTAHGVSYGFTDATLVADGRLAFVACAEDSADVRSDGPVHGCRFGWIDLEAGAATIGDVVEESGEPTALKIEGLEARPAQAGVFDVVADMDRPDEPAVLAALRVVAQS